MSDHAKSFRLPDLVVPVQRYRAVTRAAFILEVVQQKSPSQCIQCDEVVLTFSLALVACREPSSLKASAFLLQGHLDKLQLVKVRAHAGVPLCMALVSFAMMEGLGPALHRTASFQGHVQDGDVGAELGIVSTRGNPFKRVWDAALLLHGMGLLQFEVRFHTPSVL